MKFLKIIFPQKTKGLSMSKKQKYRIRNWSDYNEALVSRGSITFWFDEESIQKWHTIKSTGKRGRPQLYADIAIQCTLTIRQIFQLPLRAVEGFMRSLIQLADLGIKTPDYTTLSIRQKTLEVCLIKYEETEDNLHIVVDSTGLKVFGEGEWKVRQHGYCKRRTWRKLHLAVNADTQEIEAAVVSTNDFKDNECLPDLLEQIEGDIAQVSGDGGYDSHEVYQFISDIGANPVIPPRKDAVIAQHGNCKENVLPRDEVLRQIRQLGRKNWKKESGYHQRSLAETAMYRIKKIFGGILKSRTFESQAVEAFLRCCALNKMTQLGMPDSYLLV